MIAMGYMLPIEPYQHMNYQLREPVRMRNISTVERPFRSVLERQYQDINSHHDRLVKGNQTNIITNNVNRQVMNTITGKGIHFDRVI